MQTVRHKKQKNITALFFTVEKRYSSTLFVLFDHSGDSPSTLHLEPYKQTRLTRFLTWNDLLLLRAGHTDICIIIKTGQMSTECVALLNVDYVEHF